MERTKIIAINDSWIKWTFCGLVFFFSLSKSRFIQGHTHSIDKNGGLLKKQKKERERGSPTAQGDLGKWDWPQGVGVVKVKVDTHSTECGPSQEARESQGYVFWFGLFL